MTLPRRFPVTSIDGSKYLLIIYDYDSNAILAEPIKSRSDSEILRAYDKTINLLKSRGLSPQLHRLDNEASKALRDHLKHDLQVDYQLAPPHIH